MMVLKPALKKIFAKGTLVFGPFAADGFLEVVSMKV
jgi:4-hydroxythreonine-4-phosphate dehydrogenase